MEKAPLYTDIQGLPQRGQAFWRVCSDGVRIRVAFWKSEGPDSILIFPGRTEYIEKYANVIEKLQSRGFSVGVIDWRGQGLADRHPTRPQMGWVTEFSDYQLDVAEYLAAAQDQGLGKPKSIIAHSMGGAIGLRALLNGLETERAIFSAPMWEIYVEPKMRLFAAAVAAIGPKIGLGQKYLPQSGPKNYVQDQKFDGNTLTNFEPTYNWMRDVIDAHPDLGLGGASVHWYNRARVECSQIQAQSPAKHPILTLLGTSEAIVSKDAIEHVMGKWPNGKLVKIDKAQHEVLMEEPHVLDHVWGEIDAFLA